MVPYTIVRSRPSSLPVWLIANPANAAALLSGTVIIALGLTLVCVTVWHFATVGRGTLAPWDPPRRLVVVGVYRHVRNPMISGVLVILLGEALALRSLGVLAWAVTFLAINMTYIPLLEQPLLLRRFGEDYQAYRRNVPRWVPRAKPWQPPRMDDGDQRSVGGAGPAPD